LQGFLVRSLFVTVVAALMHPDCDRWWQAYLFRRCVLIFWVVWPFDRRWF
jgi:hypothetical protein